MKRALVVEDDPDIVELIVHYLRAEGFEVEALGDGRRALERLRAGGHDVVILDLQLPGLDGLSLCAELRRDKRTRALPVIMLTARGDEADRVVGLEVGADDYVVKPFSLKELAARAKVALRRAAGHDEGPQGYRDENWEIEFDAYVVRYRGEEIRLTHKEFELFRYMVERAGRVLTRERLLERVWGWETEIDARSIDAHIRRLRVKLGPARDHVETVVGLGYRFVK